MISEVFDGNTTSERIVIEYMPQKIKHPRFKNLPRNVFCTQRENNLAEERGLLPREDHDWIVQFLAEIAQARFDLEFWVEPRFSVEGVNNIYVFDGTECLGRITRDEESNWSKTIYAFYNNRIDKELQRERGKKTSKLVTAKSIFRTYFTKLTLTEQCKAIRRQVSNRMLSTKRDSNGAVSEAENAIIRYVRTQLTNDDKLFKEYMQNAGAIDLVDAWVDKRENYNLVAEANEKVADRKGVFLLRKKLPNGEDRYYFDGGTVWANINHGYAEHRPYPKEHLTEKVKLALGLLKVSEPNTFIAGAGYKLNDDSFFIDAEEMEFDS